MNGPTPHEVALARDDHGITAGILQQITEAVEVMKNTPAIRLRAYHQITFQHSADSETEVDAIAAGLGAVPEWNDAGTHYVAVKEYGPNVAYLVVFITPAHMDAYKKHWASFPAEPELAGAAA